MVQIEPVALCAFITWCAALFRYREKMGEKMGHITKRFADGSFLEYDEGKFDKWCVYYTDSEGDRNPPRDIDYFNQLRELSSKYGVDRIYGDFVKVYDFTGKKVTDDGFNQISNIASKYGADALEVDVLFSILYMAMVAEECKQNTRLGRRIKRLGIHKLLVEEENVYQAANFMRGMGWRDIARMCEERGF